MVLAHFGLFISGVLTLASEPADRNLQRNRDKLQAALADFGNENFTWPNIYVAPFAQETEANLAKVPDEARSLAVMDGLQPVHEEGVKDVLDEPLVHKHPIDTPPEPTVSLEPENKGRALVLRHPSNDNPADLEHDVFHFRMTYPTRPVCTFFQHSVLGEDFGASLFPRISYVGSEALPYRVHYMPDDNLRFESYRWPFAACNQGCELQALQIRAMFDWELDPVNSDSPLDKETKKALMLAREICEWKNAHYHFVLKDALGLRTVRSRQMRRALSNETPTTQVRHPGLFTSPDVQAAIQEIEGIFRANKGAQDIAAMFHTVIIACQIHRYTTTPMAELAIGSPSEMVQQAMNQVARVFAETQGRIPVWETRDAIVRATQIYRYQEEGGQ